MDHLRSSTISTEGFLVLCLWTLKEIGLVAVNWSMIHLVLPFQAPLVLFDLLTDPNSRPLVLSCDIYHHGTHLISCPVNLVLFRMVAKYLSSARNKGLFSASTLV